MFGETIDADTILPSTADDDSFVVTMVRLRAAQRKRAEAEARKRGLDLSELIRGWVDEGLAEVEDDCQVSAADLKRILAGMRHTG
ncbi:hypothetical protein [Nocardia gipuzkoensis]